MTDTRSISATDIGEFVRHRGCAVRFKLGLQKKALPRGLPFFGAIAQQERDERNRLKLLPVFLQAAGRQAEAEAALKAQIVQWADTGAFFVAQTYAYRGDHDHALEWLERAYKQKDANLAFIAGEPLLKSLADDPRYQAFLRRMNLPESPPPTDLKKRDPLS